MTSLPALDAAAAGVSCVIPVYNEAERIGGVLAAVVGHPLVGEVIVVDDASTDETLAIVKATQGVRWIGLSQNGGKSRALQAGVREATGPLLLLIDGDLVGLSRGHITALILPVLEGRADISLSLRENAPRPWRLIGLDYISGERVFAKALLNDRLESLQTLPKFGFEVYLNGLCIEQKRRIAIVPWRGVRSPLKSLKYGFLKGMLADIRMMADICRTVSPLSLLHQIVAMRRLRVEPSAAVGRQSGESGFRGRRS
jgi:hypothetical protein